MAWFSRFQFQKYFFLLFCHIDSLGHTSYYITGKLTVYYNTLRHIPIGKVVQVQPIGIRLKVLLLTDQLPIL